MQSASASLSLSMSVFLSSVSTSHPLKKTVSYALSSGFLLETVDFSGCEPHLMTYLKAVIFPIARYSQHPMDICKLCPHLFINQMRLLDIKYYP